MCGQMTTRVTAVASCFLLIFEVCERSLEVNNSWSVVAGLVSQRVCCSAVLRRINVYTVSPCFAHATLLPLLLLLLVAVAVASCCCCCCCFFFFFCCCCCCCSISLFTTIPHTLTLTTPTHTHTHGPNTDTHTQKKRRGHACPPP